jgi:hypothetical protein
MTLQETIAVTKQTAEGVKSCESVLDLARRHDVDMPITETVFEIVHEGKSPVVAVKELMSRSASRNVAERSAPGGAAGCRWAAAAPSWLVAQFPAPLWGAVRPPAS